MKEKENAPMYNSVDPKECTHVGYFVPLGYKVFRDKLVNGEELFTIVSGKVCIRCGTEFNAVSKLTKPNPVNN